MQNKEALFNKVIQENDERIHRICRYYNTNPDDQKDMYQEILVNIWKSLDNFKGKASIHTWIYRVAVNTSLSYTGKAYKQMKLVVNQSSEHLSKLVHVDTLSDKIEKEDQYNLIQNVLNTLSVIDKALISLMLEDLSMKEIADIIGITEANVKVKIHRIKMQLKEELNK